jgi:hypothetical protein
MRCRESRVYRAIGGWEYTPASNPIGQCVSNETLKAVLMETPSVWTNIKHTFLRS